MTTIRKSKAAKKQNKKHECFGGLQANEAIKEAYEIMLEIEEQIELLADMLTGLSRRVTSLEAAVALRPESKTCVTRYYWDSENKTWGTM